MPPRKATKSAPILPPNDTHPARGLISAALTAGHPHPASYHSFITSRFLPQSEDSQPPKKRARTAQRALPELLESPLDAIVLQKKLLAWYDTVKDTRSMPWRKEVTPSELSKAARSQRGYEVWVSEIMLQQTQVSTVIGYWTRWMERFPTVTDLAKADIEDVNEVWKGLGYYSRASRLHKGAQTVVSDFKGRLPETASELEKVDGIGPYSAGAISSIAFAARSPLVDGNVQRVFSRLTALHAPATAKATTNLIWALADVLVPAQPASPSESELSGGGPNKPGAWNQALMELGATVCTPKAPKCHECPLSEECLAYAEVRYAASRPPPPSSSLPDIEECTLCSPIDDFSRSSHEVAVYPMAKERKKPREEETAACVLEWESSVPEKKGEKRVLLVKRPEKGLLAGLFEFPAVDIAPSDTLSTSSSRRKLVQRLLSTLLDDPVDFSGDSTRPNALKVVSSMSLAPVTHVYSHMIRTYRPLRIVLTSPSLPSLSPSAKVKDDDGPVQSLAGRGKWYKESEVEGANTGGAVEKIWEQRERDRKGLPPAPAPKERKAAAPKDKKGALLAGQTTLSFGKAAPKKSTSVSKGKPRKTRDGYETEGSEADRSLDESIVVVASESEEEEPKFVPSAIYKKRRIVQDSDEEDD